MAIFIVYYYSCCYLNAVLLLKLVFVYFSFVSFTILQPTIQKKEYTHTHTNIYTRQILQINSFLLKKQQPPPPPSHR